MAKSISSENTDDVDPAKSDVPTADRHDRFRRRLTLTWGLAIVTCVAAVLLALELFVARRLPELTIDRLEAARAIWEESGQQSYDLDLEIFGERPGPVHVEVRGGEVTQVTINGRSPSPHTRHTWTVDGQFNTLEQELILAEDPVHQMQAQAGASLRLRCEFDPQFGYPREYQRTVSGGGPDVYWRVTTFVPR